MDQTELIAYPSGKSGAYSIPASVISIGGYAFRSCSSLASIAIPDGVTSIGSYAFDGCSSLTNIAIPASVTSTTGSTFSDCAGLLSIDVMAGNLHYTSVDGVLFNADKTSLIAYPGGTPGAYSIPDSVTGILSSSAFYNCRALTGITIPDWLINLNRFRGCSGLEFFDVEVGHPQYASVDGVVFNTNQTELVKYPEGKPGAYFVPSGVASIGDFAFRDCNSLPGITFPASLTHIGEWAFRGGTSLLDITIPAGVTSGHGAYLECTGLESIFVEEGNVQFTSVDGVLFNTNQTELVAYPAGRSGSYSIPEGVITLGSAAFSEGGLTNITIPASIANVGFLAFSFCDKLSAAIFLGDAPVFGWGVFDGTDANFTIHYLSGNSGFRSPIWRGYPATSWFMDGGLDPATDLDQDVNGDGVTLLTAYALNLDPSLDLSGSLPGAEVAADAMGMTYYSANPGITYILETSTDLETWTDAGVSVSGLDPQCRRTATVDLVEPHRFLRLRVEQ